MLLQLDVLQLLQLVKQENEEFARFVLQPKGELRHAQGGEMQDGV